MKYYEKKYNKYHNARTIIDNITFSSKLESNRYKELKLLERQGIIKDLKLQPSFILIPTFKKNNTTYRQISYKADFMYYDNDLKKVVIEDTKGYANDIYKIKRKLFEYIYKDLTIKEVRASKY